MAHSIKKAKEKVANLQQEAANDAQIIERAKEMVVNNDEAEYLKEYLSLYRKLKKLIRRYNKKALVSNQSRDVYALSTLMSQQREVIADLRTLTDLSGQVNLINVQVLQPMVNEVGQYWLTAYYHLRKLLIETTKEKETQFALKKLDELTRDLSVGLQQQYDVASLRIQETVIGRKEQPTKKKKK